MTAVEDGVSHHNIQSQDATQKPTNNVITFDSNRVLLNARETKKATCAMNLMTSCLAEPLQYDILKTCDHHFRPRLFFFANGCTFLWYQPSMKKLLLLMFF